MRDPGLVSSVCAGLSALAFALSGCSDGSSGSDAYSAQTAARVTSPSENIGYSYNAVAAPSGGLTATNVQDGIDQSAAVAYGALTAADDALVQAKAHADAGDTSVLAQAAIYTDGAAALAQAAAQTYADSEIAIVAAAAAPCPSTCQASVTSVHQRDLQGNCAMHFRYPCQPYACDDAGVTCNDFCISDADCSIGARCDTLEGHCTTGVAECADAFTILTADGQLASCIPYECLNGQCQQQCVHSSDCAGGYHCTEGNCYENG